MAAFLGDIAFLIGIIVIASGLIVLHKAKTDPDPEFLRIAGKLLVIAGLLTAICTSYFYLKYHFSGDLEHPYPDHGMPMMKMDKQQMHKMMMNMSSQENAPIQNENNEHEEHHPGE